MLSQSDRSIEVVVDSLATRGIQAGYLVPTYTGLGKSILDAHAQLRNYLRLSKLHDFSSQPQGEQAKKIVEGVLVTSNGYVPTKISLYRPDTKLGDPRIWIYGLKSYAAAGNLLVLLVHKGTLYVCNASDPGFVSLEGHPAGHFARLLVDIANDENAVARELIVELRAIAQRGWITSMRAGPTGVGYTLETLLGIRANSRPDPDYNGIEIKAGRTTISGVPSTRTTLFSKTPDWKSSALNSGLALLDRYGYLSESGRLQLYCSLSSSPNSLGHFLAVSDDEVLLNAAHQAAGGVSEVLSWEMEVLRDSLKAKHRETFWVKAHSRIGPDGEQFRYTLAVHTREPLLANLAAMFRLGRIELDYLLHEVQANGGRRARDHGYLFKMWPANIPHLFPPPLTYALM